MSTIMPAAAVRKKKGFEWKKKFMFSDLKQFTSVKLLKYEK